MKKQTAHTFSQLKGEGEKLISWWSDVGLLVAVATPAWELVYVGIYGLGNII